MTPRERALLKEFLRRNQSRPSLRTQEFLKQNLAIDDDSKLRAWNCTRRAGKSTAAGIDLIETMEKYPKTKCLYLALTLGSARGILWEEIRRLSDLGRVDLRPNEKYSTWRHPNGSTVQFFGMDASKKEMQKVLGQKYKKVFIDEAGSMTIDMTKLCYQSLEPALMDLNGQLTLLGTCENIPNTFFERVTEGKEKRWTVHKWTTADNPYMKDIWAREITNMLAENPKITEASWFKTHYLNIWCQDDDLLIIPFSEENNTISVNDWEKLKTQHEFFYVLGVDLGFNDASSFNVLAFSLTHPTCYRVRGYKKSGLILTKVGEEIQKLREEYDIHKIVIDGANKQGVEDLKVRMGLPLINAEKTGKPVYLKALKDDMVTGRFKVVEGHSDSWILEISHLQWLDMNQLKEDPRCENHENDGTLYAWRECRHYASEPIKPKAKYNSSEYMLELEKQQAQILDQQLKEEQEWNMMNLESY